MVDNGLMAYPAQVTIDTKHIHIIVDTTSKNNFDKEECGDIVNDEVNYDQDKGGYKLGSVSNKCPLFCKCSGFLKSGFATFSNSAGCQT